MSVCRPLPIAARYDRFVVDETLALLRHDLRNKVAAVRNAAFYVRKRLEAAPPAGDPDPRLPQMLAVIKGELDGFDAQMASRLGPPSGTCDAAAVAEELPTWLDAESRARISVTATGPAPVLLPREDLLLALFCLVENALDAGPAVRASVSVTPGAESISVGVRDDGPGFAGEAAQRHLEPFFSTRAQLGLGLNLARRIAQRGDGRLEIAGGAGGGVVAELVLPRGTRA